MYFKYEAMNHINSPHIENFMTVMIKIHNQSHIVMCQIYFMVILHLYLLASFSQIGNN